MKHDAQQIPENEYTEITENKSSALQGFGEQEASQLATVIGRFMQAYAEHPEDAEDSAAWLENQLATELPEKSREEIQSIRQEIQKSVVAWDENMRSLNDACAEGKSKEEWLEAKLQEASVGVNVEDYSHCLEAASAGLHQANRNAIQQVDGMQAGPEEEGQPETDQERAPANTHDLAIQLGKEIEVSSLAGTVLGTGWKLAENLPMGEKLAELRQVGEELRSGDDQGIKEAASAALKTGMEKGYIPFLPKDTPTSVTSGLACCGVEQAKVLLKFADGDISGGQALNLMGRAATVSASNVLSSWGSKIGAQIGQKVGLLVTPIMPALAPIGMAVGTFVGGMVGRIGGSAIGKVVSKAARKIAEVAKPVLNRAWEGIKSIGRSIGNAVSGFVNWLFG